MHILISNPYLQGAIVNLRQHPALVTVIRSAETLTKLVTWLWTPNIFTLNRSVPIFYSAHPPVIPIIYPYLCSQHEINKIIHLNIGDERDPCIFLCFVAIIHELRSRIAAKAFRKWQMIVAKSSINHDELDFGVWRTKTISVSINHTIVIGRFVLLNLRLNQNDL